MQKMIIFIILTNILSVIGCKEETKTIESIGELSKDTLYKGVTGDSLLVLLKRDFQVQDSYSYSKARYLIYGTIDLNEVNELETIYTQYTIKLTTHGNLIDQAYDQGVNCEHVYPQSKGARELPMKSDMHHLFPCKENVNSARKNYRFAEIDDEKAEQWFSHAIISDTIPQEHIENYSELAPYKFEPREAIKGDIARAVMYFYTIYNGIADETFFNKMKKDLIQWHKQDPVSQKELNRNNTIRYYQGNDNPFILDKTLPERIWSLP